MAEKRYHCISRNALELHEKALRTMALPRSEDRRQDQPHDGLSDALVEPVDPSRIAEEEIFI